MAREAIPTKTNQVLESLRNFIIEGEYRPDQRLYVDEVAERLEVSQTPVREALRQLEAEGLVTSLPHRGWVVARASFEEIQEIFLIRRVLEGLATELATPNLTPADLAELARIQKEGTEAVEKLDFHRSRHLNIEFHWVIYQAARAPQLARFLQLVWSRLPSDLGAIVRGMAEQSHCDHGVLLDAMRSRDPNRAAELMEQHMSNMLECYVRWGRSAGIDRAPAQTRGRVLQTGTASPDDGARPLLDRQSVRRMARVDSHGG